MRKNRLSMIVLVWVMLGLIGCRTPVSEATFVESFLRLKFAKSVSNDIPLVIKQNLSMGPCFDKKQKNFPTDLIRRYNRQDKRLIEAVKDFWQKNTGMNSFESIDGVDLSHVVLMDKEVTALFNTKGKGWKGFYKMYPKSPGIITLSRPGFSFDGTLAVIYMGNQLHMLAGHGGIYVFEKKNGKWVKSMIRIGVRWVS